MSEDLISVTAQKTIKALEMNTKQSFHMLALLVCYKASKPYLDANAQDEFDLFVEKVKSRAIEVLWDIKVLDNYVN